MMNIASPLNTQDMIEFDIREIQSLIDSIPLPALILDSRSELIVLVNHSLISFCGYTSQELVNQHLAYIIPVDDEKNTLGNLKDLYIQHKDGKKSNIKIQKKTLSPFGWWAILTIELVQEPHPYVDKNTPEFFQQITKKISDLGNYTWPEEPEDGAQQALTIAQIVSGSSVLASYLVEPDQPLLKLAQVEGDSKYLPTQISLRELANLNVPTLWTPNQRPLLPLHRTARSAGMSYVASAPVGGDNAQIGLVIAMGDQEQPPELVLPTTMILARHLGNVIENQKMQQFNAEVIASQENLLAQFEKIHDTLQDGIILVSSEGLIKRINAYSEQMLGYENSEVVDRSIEDILIGKENWQIALEIAKKIGYTHDLGMITLYRRDGRACHAQVRIQPLPNPNGFSGWGILLQDLSQQEQYRQRSQQLEQRAQLGEVTAIFAHEVRNPINNISTGLQLMAMNLADDDPLQDQIGRMQQDCDRLSELMKSVLAFARPQEYQLSPLIVEPILSRLLERWHPRLTKVNVKTELFVEKDTPNIIGDLRALEQVFTNLIHNAMQAMDKNGGNLVVRARPVVAESGNQYVEISFTDNGPGIPDEIRERIFEPFFTTRDTGTGLGLAITKQIITAHRGSIRVTSVPGGTAFRVTLPVQKPNSE